MKRTVLLDDLDREYTLEEIAIITRAGPARLLGLRDKGHLGVGADADITIYDDRDDREAMFAAPRYVIKDGRPVVEDGELREAGLGRLLRVGAEYDPSIEPTLEKLFEDRYSVQFEAIPCASRGCSSPRAPSPRSPMKLHGAEIVDTFAEAFPMRRARRHHRGDAGVGAGGGPLADRLRHLGDRVQVRGGHRARARRGRDARRAAGLSALLFAMDRDGVAKRLVERVGQTADVPDDGLLQRPGRRGHRRRRRPAAFFGDGYQASKVLDGRRYWRMPVMEGEFLVEERFGVVEGVAGGNIIMLARPPSRRCGRRRRRRARCGVEGVIMPFPGGIARSGSKVGSRYSALPASTNDALCPTLRAQVERTDVPPDVESVFEIVIDGFARAGPRGDAPRARRRRRGGRQP